MRHVQFVCVYLVFTLPKYRYFERPVNEAFKTVKHHKVSVFFFNVLLTVHLSIFILVINQLDAQNFVLQ